MPISVACSCGAELEAPNELSGLSVKCPQCAQVVPIPGEKATVGLETKETVQPVSSKLEAANLPVELKAKIATALQENEHLTWLAKPSVRIAFVRSLWVYVLGGAVLAVGVLALVGILVGPAQGQPVRPGQGSSLLVPAIVIGVAVLWLSVPLYRLSVVSQTCYAITNRRALVCQAGLFGASLDSYSPSQLTGMRRKNSWLCPGAGDVIFRTVTVVTTTYRAGQGGSSRSERTTLYGFLNIPQVNEAEKVLREALVDRFVDKLKEAERS